MVILLLLRELSDLIVLIFEQEVQQLDTPSTVIQSNSMSEINNGSDVSLASVSKPALSGGGLIGPRPAGPGMGKPMFDEQYEKKLTAGRNKVQNCFNVFFSLKYCFTAVAQAQLCCFGELS